MGAQGIVPGVSALTPAQVKLAVDPQYLRIDGANRPPHVFNNALINPSFEHWQRGNGAFGGSGNSIIYGPDRWRIYNVGINGITSITKQFLAFGDAPTLSRYACMFACAQHSAAGDGTVVQQFMEGVDTFAGRRVVVRGLARCVNAGQVGSKVAVELEQGFGTGGSANVPTYVGQITLAQALTPFSFTVDVPSMLGKVIGSASDYLSLNLWISGGASWNGRTGNLPQMATNVVFTDVEVKEVKPGYGDQFPGFERVPRELDLLRAQRFYQFGTLRGAIGGAQSSAFSTNYVGISQRLSVPMRILPNGTYTDGNGTANSVTTGNRTTGFSAGGLGAQDTQTIFVDGTLPQTDNLYWWYLNYKLTAEY